MRTRKRTQSRRLHLLKGNAYPCPSDFPASVFIPIFKRIRIPIDIFISDPILISVPLPIPIIIPIPM
jgi:hypothetical protein